MSSSDSLRLLLIDADSVFRLSIKVWLDQYPDLRIVAEAEDGETALHILEAQILEAQTPPETSELRASESVSPSGTPLDSGTLEATAQTLSQPTDLPINFVVLDIGLGQANPNQLQGLALGRLIKSRYPALPLLFLSTSAEPIVLAAAQQIGANGYCPKRIEPIELVTVIRQIAAGQPCWIRDWQLAAQPQQPVEAERRFPRSSPQPLSGSRSFTALAVFRRSLRVSGIQQIEAALNDVSRELQNLDLSVLDRAVLAGHQRELRAARWLVNQLLSTPKLEASLSAPPETARPAVSFQTEPSIPRSPRIPVPSVSSAAPQPAVSPSASALATQPLSAIAEPRGAQSITVDAVLAKIQTGLTNQTEVALEIDILREDKKRDLLYLILRKFEDLLDELRYSQVELDQLPWKRLTLLLDLWQVALVDFFGKYYTVQLGESEKEVVETLLQDAAIVQSEILDKIPGVTHLLQHFLFQTPLPVDSIPYAVGNPESLARAELLLENLIIQVANAVMQPLLNHFANVESVKQNFYDRRLLSSREIERFRNNLSWRYRVDRVFREPKNIFESQYRLFTLTGRSIKQTSIYAPRAEELEQLSGLPYVITLALETRDAISPRLRSVVSFAGNGFVYILTEVIGRGIGLVGRGVLKGLGNVWQDTKYGRDRNQR